MNYLKTVIIVTICTLLAGCPWDNQAREEAKIVEKQQSQINKAQPVPIYDFSIERDLLIQLYNMRNSRVATHSVWRGEMSVIEGDCPSMGFSLPYDTSLTNPVTAKLLGPSTYKGMHVVDQPEPNAIFPSKNTTATWVFCAGKHGQLDPHYVEAKVTVYPYPVKVDYENNRVHKAGESSIKLKVKQ